MRLQQAIQKISNNRTSGATELARQALEWGGELALSVPAANSDDLLRRLGDYATKAAAVRPSMAPLHNLMQRWRSSLNTIEMQDLAAARQEAAAAATAIIRESQMAAERMFRRAAGAVGGSEGGKTIITHSYSSTVLQILRLLAGWDIEVIVSEARPLNEGVTLATRLADLKIKTNLITDAQIGLFAARADLALVGADALLEDGSVVNKAGTLLLALACREKEVPFYVCAETFKQWCADMGTLELEEMAIAELGYDLPSPVTARNIYFDITPSHLVTAWFNDSDDPAV